MFKYLFVAFVACIKHMLIGFSNALSNTAGYLNHYQMQLEARINHKAQQEVPTNNAVTVIHEPRCEVMEDGKPNPEQLQ